MIGRLLFIGFVALPLVEIALFIVVGQALGVWATLALVVLSALLGAAILRHRGLARLRDIQAMMGRGQFPGRALADAALISAAGVLLLVPGFFTDLVGLLLLLPPCRTLIYALVLTWLVPTVVTRPSAGPASGPRTIELDPEQFRPRSD